MMVREIRALRAIRVLMQRGERVEENLIRASILRLGLEPPKRKIDAKEIGKLILKLYRTKIEELGKLPVEKNVIYIKETAEELIEEMAKDLSNFRDKRELTELIGNVIMLIEKLESKNFNTKEIQEKLVETLKSREEELLKNINALLYLSKECYKRKLTSFGEKIDNLAFTFLNKLFLRSLKVEGVEGLKNSLVLFDSLAEIKERIKVEFREDALRRRLGEEEIKDLISLAKWTRENGLPRSHSFLISYISPILEEASLEDLKKYASELRSVPELYSLVERRIVSPLERIRSLVPKLTRVEWVRRKMEISKLIREGKKELVLALLLKAKESGFLRRESFTRIQRSSIVRVLEELKKEIGAEREIDEIISVLR